MSRSIAQKRGRSEFRRCANRPLRFAPEYSSRPPSKDTAKDMSLAAVGTARTSNRRSKCG